MLSFVLLILKIWGFHLKSWPIYLIPLDLLYSTITFGCAYMVCLISIFQTFFWNQKYWILFKTLHCISVHIHNFKPLNSMIPYFKLKDSLSLKFRALFSRNIFCWTLLENVTIYAFHTGGKGQIAPQPNKCLS